jgi:hypothetical protein
LSPPSVRLSCRMALPLELFHTGTGGRLRLDVRGVQLDRAGLHFPEAVKLALEGKTFATPICALSDPYLTFQATERGPVFGIGAKITPSPLAGIVPNPDNIAAAYGLDFRTGLRLDNPWLHVVYCDTCGTVRFRDVEFKLAGTVRLLDAHNLAHAHLTWTLPSTQDPSGALTGHLEASLPSLPDLPPFQLNGDVRIDDSGIRAAGLLRLSTLGHAAAALRFGPVAGDTGTRRSEIALKARARVVGLNFDLDGHSDVRFRDYRLVGETRVAVDYLVGTSTLLVRVVVTPGNVLVTEAWESGGRFIQKSFSAPSVDLLDELEIRRAVIVAHEQASSRPFAAVREDETYLRSNAVQTQRAVAEMPVAPSAEPRPGNATPIFDQPVGDLVPFDDPLDQNPAPRVHFKYFREADARERALRGEGVPPGSLIDGLVLYKKDVGDLEHLAVR